ncbi:hypothetical protein F9B85_10630 [Heliorestis acidaminivorans]|uniref:Uncharacterized protein n=1 Tax=Heliorestis acidaminivorans TaxID=553427 RepID=A0A6I0EXP9_9FIRM|nr:hypothetical protein [Heliorestis acidaminivorans]KAB2952003.1 hypothetical protein F9B85_10630 [Heliorestis acidaminivorans]
MKITKTVTMLGGLNQGIVQVSANIKFLIESNYLSSKDWGYCIQLCPYLSPSSNLLVSAEEYSHGYGMITALSLNKIANIYGKSRRQVTRVVSQLIKKGILLEKLDSAAEEEKERLGKVVRQREIYMNPELIYAGDLQQINMGTCLLLKRNDVIEQHNIKMPLKVIVKQEEEYGVLVTRKQYEELMGMQ